MSALPELALIGEHSFLAVPLLHRSACQGYIINSREQASLTMSAVKLILSTLRRALQEERHFALVDGFALPTVGSLRNRFRSGTQSDPCISSIRSRDHDYYFELLFL